MRAALGICNAHRRPYLREMRIALREIAKQSARVSIDPFGLQSQFIGVSADTLEQRTGIVQATREREILNQPVTAQHERALAFQILRKVAVDKPIHTQLLVNSRHRSCNARITCGQKLDEWYCESSGVECGFLEHVCKRANLFIRIRG